jgi:hypothetical protein
MEGTTYIVEEEFPEEFLHMDSKVSKQDNNNKVGKEAYVVKAVNIGIAQENHPFLAPPPLNTIPQFSRTLPPLFIPEKLELIFDLRSQMVE